MSQFLDYLIWALLVTALPISVYYYIRSKRRLVLVLVVAATAMWGGTLAGIFAEPIVVVTSGPNDTLQSNMVMKGSKVGATAVVAGVLVYLVVGTYLLVTPQKGQR